MVKNNFGGNKSKKIARKEVTARRDPGLEMAIESNELYAQIRALPGGLIAKAEDLAGKPLLVHIRRNFRGKNKKNNLLQVGTWVMVEWFEWEHEKPDKPRNCNLRVVYSEEQKKTLRMTLSSVNWTPFVKFDDSLRAIALERESKLEEENIRFASDYDQYATANTVSTATANEPATAETEYGTDWIDVDAI